MDKISSIINYLRANDLPNWIIFGFTGIAWPLVVFLYYRRKVNNIPNLIISLNQSTMTITNSTNPNGISYPTVQFNFKNNTGQIIYLANPRIVNCSKTFSIPVDASRGIGENSYELNFMDANSKYTLQQYILQTDKIAVTGIAVNHQMSNDFFSYNPNWIHRRFYLIKYFKIEFTAMVGDKKYKVSTLY
jgi:hypothetical protein